MKTQRRQARRPTYQSLDSQLLKEAELSDTNLSRSAESGGEAAVHTAKQALWLKDNQDALASSNSYVEQRGLPLAEFRQF